MGVLEAFSLSGKVAVVVGGSGKYGKAITAALSQAGARTYATTRRQDNVEALQNEFAQSGGNIRVAYMDQTEEDTAIQLKDRILREEGRLDVVVVNAIARTMSDWHDPAERFAESMNVNATGLFVVTRAFGDVMAERGGGSIIHIGSIQGMVGPDKSLYEGLDFHGFVPDYFFHKGGMVNFTRFAASYYGPRNVRCNCVSPGGVRSGQTPAEFEKRYSERTMLGRMADVTDISGTVVFLASDASAYITGANIPVDGGYTAK